MAGYYYFDKKDSRPARNPAGGEGATSSFTKSEAAGAPLPRGEESAVPAFAGAGASVFQGGDQDFVSLKLDQVDVVNHNTKKLRFSFPDAESISGLEAACKSSFTVQIYSRIADIYIVFSGRSYQV